MDKVTYNILIDTLQTEIEFIGKHKPPRWSQRTATPAETILSPADYDVYKTLRDMQMQLMRLKITYWQKLWAE